MQEPRHPAVSEDRQQLLKTLLRRSWHGPVLRALADGPTRFVDIRRKVRAEHGRSAGDRPRRPPGDGQISAVLKDLVDRGLAEKHEEVAQRPWQPTEHGRTALHDLEMFDRLDKGEIGVEPASESAAGTIDSPTELKPSTVFAGTSDDRRAALMVQPKGTINMTVAHPARRYNYWLGGNDNFQADRDSAEQFEKAVPGMRAGVLENRRAHGRIVHYLAAKAGIRQFLDIGTGLPAPDNTHEVAQAVDPSSRIVYVDNDPLVLAHAQALLTGAPEGRTAYLQADLRVPATILENPIYRNAIDPVQPVALLLIAVLHFIPGDGAAKPLVDQLMSALPPGSFLAITHATHDFHTPELVKLHQEMQRDGRSDFWLRPKKELLQLFEGLEIVAPGMVPNTQWHPAPTTPDLDLHIVGSWACVGRKP